MRCEFVRLIEREIANARAGHPASIVVKCNGLDDHVGFLLFFLSHFHDDAHNQRILVQKICACFLLVGGDFQY
jgi:hypothetical protein